jgi:hypothetical protein
LYALGRCYVGSNGEITIGVGVNGGNYQSGSGVLGFYSFAMTWNINI